MGLNEYEQKLLAGWGDVFKKGQLSVWIMLGLADSPKHMAEIKQFIHNVTNGRHTADDQSMYRALRRYHDAELIEFTSVPSDNGPDLKIYRLTPTGERVLKVFLRHNIAETYYRKDIRSLIEKYC